MTTGCSGNNGMSPSLPMLKRRKKHSFRGGINSGDPDIDRLFKEACKKLDELDKRQRALRAGTPVEQAIAPPRTVSLTPTNQAPALPVCSLPKTEDLNAPKNAPFEAFGVAPIQNQGNTCFAAVIVQTWLLANEDGIRSQRKNWFEAEAYDKSTIADFLIQLISQYKQVVATDVLGTTGEASPKGVDILLLLVGVFSKIDPAMKRAFPDYVHKCQEKVSLGLGRPWFDQQDADQMIVLLYDFIYGENPTITQQGILFLQPDRGDILLDDNGAPLRSQAQHSFLAELYAGRIQIPVPHEKRGDRFVVTPDCSFPKIFQKAFYASQEPLKRTVITEDGRTIEKDINVQARREYLSTAPMQLNLLAMRFGVDEKGISYRVEGAIPGIEERMDIPGDYFIDGKSAAYLFDSAIIHEGGKSPDSGHYIAIVKKFNPETKQRCFYKVSDAIITPISVKDALTYASQAYILFFKKI